MKVTVLGCGTSSGVPRIGGDWGACDPAEPRNRRTRASILVQTRTTTILVDTGPDMRAQLLSANVGAVDAVIWTHEHADHTHGIDDLRQLFHVRNAPVPGFARPETLALLQRRFHYVFHGRGGYPPTSSAHLLPDAVRIGDIDIRVTDMPHGDIMSAGLRFDADGASCGYATDFHIFTDGMGDLFEGVDLWIIDALRYKPHPTHPHLDMALELVDRMKVKRAVLTHMDQSMDYATLCATLPSNAEPGYDGLQIELS